MVDLKIAIVGTGAVGWNIAVSLKRIGSPVFCIISRDIQTARERADTVDAQFLVRYGDVLPEGIDLLFLCVPDDLISSTSESLANLPYEWEKVCVAHTSGALSASALSELASLGANVFSFHPVQTFTKEHESEWNDIFIGIEGDDVGVQIGHQVATSLGSIPLHLKEEDKVLYHASAVFASNFFVTVIGIATDILSQINISREDATNLLAPLIQRTCQNILASGPEKALTGPASRGDIQTIKRHAKAIGNSLPDKYHIYLGLTREAVELKHRSDPEFEEKARIMHRTLEQLLRE